MEEPIPISSDDEDDVQFVQEDKSPATKKNVYWANRTTQDHIIDAWQECSLVKEFGVVDGNRMYHVKFCDDEHQKRVAEFELASYKEPMYMELIRGTRVIARRDKDEMPYILDNSGEKKQLYKNECLAFYPGIVSGHHDLHGRYLVFFDDGIVQYVSVVHIRRVLGDYGYKHAHWNAKAYFEFILEQEDVVELAPESGNRVLVELDGAWKKVTVKEVKLALTLIAFDAPKRFEWIYLGSPRLSQVYRNLIKSKAFDKLINYKTYKTCLRATNDILNFELINPVAEPKKSRGAKKKYRSSLSFDATGVQPVTHECGPQCLRINEQTDVNGIDIKMYSAFQRPIMTGWMREKSLYKTPCGIILRNYHAIHRYLVRTNSKLNIDCFELNANIELPNIQMETLKDNDLSKGLEPIPVVVRGGQMYMDFKYITGYNYEYIPEIPENNLQRNGCDCEDFCRDKSKCSCWQLTIQCLKQKDLQKAEYKRYVDVGYKNMRLLKDVKTGIVECSSSCKCCSQKCLNRIAQRGMQHKLEVFMTKHKGWGVKTKSDLPEGIFVCHYAGDVLDEETADKKDFRYQFRLPQSKVNVSSSDEESASSDSTFEPNKQLPNKIPRMKGDGVQLSFLNYFPPIEKNAESFPESEFIVKKIKRFVIDAISHGNIARFLNHSCSPNLFSQQVFVDDDKRFPMIAFFTSRIVKADEELTFDYAYPLFDSQKTECHCGSDNCRKRLI
ncbi:histone-lysine N-methyltransferase eggless-like [Contarinia nasturtii]|uniref:histone-lysine N-methyltransferase eggless-like n=1 Tax=Contarinia nasturtii TaxID=265458 RepID=UPI0012D3ED23|nr:histone-lysine N-methyltransferase eggless-like [Contarinia nasturtii]